MTDNPDLDMTLEQAVKEVLMLLTGQELTYDSQYDRFRVVTLQLNRALRANALEAEWSYYSEIMRAGRTTAGARVVEISPTYRFRVVNDDAMRLLDSDGVPVRWAYFLPRDALHKYARRTGLWCAVTRNRVYLSRPLWESEAGLAIEIPVMREPRMFKLPQAGVKRTLPDSTLQQTVDFDYPDLVTARAAWMYAMSDPVMQPRVQTLEDLVNNLKYQAIERDQMVTDTPYINDFRIPVQHGLYPNTEQTQWPIANAGQFGR